MVPTFPVTPCVIASTLIGLLPAVDITWIVDGPAGVAALLRCTTLPRSGSAGTPWHCSPHRSPPLGSYAAWVVGTVLGAYGGGLVSDLERLGLTCSSRRSSWAS
jgi:hypothetical protein